MEDYRSHFHMPPGTYLNCAYMSPLLRVVEEAGINAIKSRRDPAAIQPQDFFSETAKVREQFANLVNAKPERIALIPSVSYGMATVVQNLPLTSSQHILVAREQFPSNYYPWKRLADRTGAVIRSVGPDTTAASRGAQWNERLLEAINSDTGVVAISHVHWADGTLFDLRNLRKRASEVGAALIIDGTQSVGALPFDVSEIKPDALVCAGYKWLMGPYSQGAAYYGERFDGGIPLEENWINRKHSEDFTGLVNYQDDYQPGAWRYGVGEHSNFTLIPMFLEALRLINLWQPSTIQSHCREISADAIAALIDAGYRIDREGSRASHLFGIRIPSEVDGPALREALSRERIVVSFRGDAIRVSPNLYNDHDDMDKLTSVLEKAASVKAKI